jgi:hypothetical protein
VLRTRSRHSPGQNRLIIAQSSHAEEKTARCQLLTAYPVMLEFHTFKWSSATYESSEIPKRGTRTAARDLSTLPITQHRTERVRRGANLRPNPVRHPISAVVR